jgi:hypothetical protein
MPLSAREERQPRDIDQADAWRVARLYAAAVNAHDDLSDELERLLGAEDPHTVASRANAAHMTAKAKLHMRAMGIGAAAND